MNTLQVHRAGGVVTITLDRPDKKNAIDDTMWDELAAVAAEVTRSTEDRCVVITGAGGAFCSGIDLGDVSGQSDHRLAVMRRVNKVMQAYRDLPQPTIAKVSGVAAGIGMSLAIGCDLVLASEDARFSAIFSKRGLSIDGGMSWLLPRLIGLQRAKEVALFGDILSAAEAAELGLVNRVVPAGELDALVDDWAGRLAAGPPIALAMTKRMLDRSFEHSFEQALDVEAVSQTVNTATADTVEAVQAFLEKREPVFRGR